jgi:hypothetical protein
MVIPINPNPDGNDLLVRECHEGIGPVQMPNTAQPARSRVA